MMGFPITGGPWLSAPPMPQPPPMFFGDPQHLVRSHIGFSGATSCNATIPRDLSTLCLMIHPTAYAPAQLHPRHHQHHQHHQPPYRQQPHFSGKPVHIAPAAPCRSARSIGNEHTGNQLGILIKQANNLRDADGLFSGGSDVYALSRTGRINSSWDSKVATERRSSTIHDCQNPNFQLAYLCGINSSLNDIAGEELHVRLFDDDGFLNSDDFLGEVRVKLTSLLQDANNQTCDYPLEGDKAKGTLTIMVGTKVGQALMEEVQNEISQSCFLSPLASMQSTVSRLGIWFADRFNLNMTPAYAVNMARLGVVWASEPARVDDAVSTFIAERSNEKGEWSGPFLENCVTFSRHSDVSSCLVSLGERLGSNNGNGSVERENFLGFQRLTSVCWPELRNIGFGYRQPSIGLGQPQEAHAFIRPLIVRLCGPDSYTELGGASWLEEQANDFFSGRRRIVVPTDLKIWTAKLQHRVMLGMCITDEEAQDFQVMQGRIIIAMAVPEPALPALGLYFIFSFLLLVFSSPLR